MIIKYEEDLSKQTFYESVGRLRELGVIKNSEHANLSPQTFLPLGEIENPVLALDAERLEKMPNGQLIYALFNQEGTPLTTFYGDTPNDWHKLNGTWPCSIDTMTHLVGQRKSDSITSDSLVLDMCCGTGIAGADALRAKGVKKVDFSDVTPECVASALINYNQYGKKSQGSQNNRYFVGDAFENIPSNVKYDIILASAVPATPSYEKLGRPINPLFEGTGVLESILRDSPEHLSPNGKLIISHSLLGEQDFNKYAQKYGAKVERILYEKQVPFRAEFLGSDEWARYLINEKGMIEKPGEDHPYWHTARVKEISFH